MHTAIHGRHPLTTQSLQIINTADILAKSISAVRHGYVGNKFMQIPSPELRGIDWLVFITAITKDCWVV
jgi:hypothetical protein